MATRDPREDRGDTTKAGVIGVVAIAVALSPFFADVHSGWYVLAFGVAMVLGATALMVGSGSNFDGPPPQRRG